MNFYEILGKVIITIIILVVWFVAVIVFPEIIKTWLDKLPNFLQVAIAIIILVVVIGGTGVLIFLVL